MKTIKNHLILIALIALISIQLSYEKKVHIKSRQNRKYGAGDTPKGLDLANHMGHRAMDSPFASQNQVAQHIESDVEQFLPQNNPPFNKALKELEFKPYPGYQAKMNPTNVKSGEFLNVAPNARGLVSPQLADPKLRVDATVNYSAVAEIPTYRGFINEYKDVNIYDRETGRIERDRLTVNHPWLVPEKAVYYIHLTIRLSQLKKHLVIISI